MMVLYLTYQRLIQQNLALQEILRNYLLFYLL